MKTTRKSIIIAIVVMISSCLLYSCSPSEEVEPVVPVTTKPSVKTMAVTMTANFDSVLVTGQIISNGNSKIITCGIKGGSNGEPLDITVSPKDSGTFVVKVPIKFGISYGFKAYAVNSVGTAYGSTISYSYNAKEPVLSSTSISEVTETSGVALDTIDNGKLPTKVTLLFGKTTSYSDSLIIDTINKNTSFKILIRSLETGSEYHFRFKAENKLKTVYSSDRMFCTSVKDIDGNLYPVIKLGNQFWIAKNLMVTHYNDGTDILNPTADADWIAAGNAKKGAFCYYNNDKKIGEVYGCLYNWYAINTGKLAIKGWHVPTHDEFIKMVVISYGLGGPKESTLKESGFDHWKSPNEGATNESGFTALPNGHRSDDRNYVFGFYDLHLSAIWWTSDEWTEGFTRVLYMDYDKADIFNNLCWSNKYGLGVRLVKD